MSEQMLILAAHVVRRDRSRLRQHASLQEPNCRVSQYRRCRQGAGQEPDVPRILFLLSVEPTLRQLRCVRQWARRRNMHLSRVEGIDWPAE